MPGFGVVTGGAPDPAGGGVTGVVTGAVAGGVTGGIAGLAGAAEAGGAIIPQLPQAL
ncbi:MAG: hypothetical protein U0746_14430 [Gemmataceae bacterium]